MSDIDEITARARARLDAETRRHQERVAEIEAEYWRKVWLTIAVVLVAALIVAVTARFGMWAR